MVFLDEQSINTGSHVRIYDDRLDDKKELPPTNIKGLRILAIEWQEEDDGDTYTILRLEGGYSIEILTTKKPEGSA